MQPIVIKTAPSGEFKTSVGTTVETLDGQPIEGVTSINISIEPNSMVTAELNVYIGGCDITAHPLLSLDSVREAAAWHGYVLTPKLSNKAAHTYPSTPRLNPKGDGYICDQCGREWDAGQDPHCAPCAAAFDLG
jgi:hypothetical protein